MLELHGDGMSTREIANELNLAEGTVCRIKRGLGIPSKYRFPWMDEQLAQAKALLEDGCPYAEVARTIGCRIDVVRRKFPDMGCEGSPLGNGKHMRIAEALGLNMNYATDEI